MITKLSKVDEVDLIVQKANQQTIQKPSQNKKNQIVHTIRAVIIIIDMTKSINMKDFKPSRLSVATSMVKFFIKKAKQNTPIIKFALAIVQNQTCKFKSVFTYDQEKIFQELDKLKVSHISGHFSMQNSLRSCILQFQEVLQEFHREILIIQSSPLTKDIRNIFDTIDILKTAKISINIISMIGWTNVYVKLIQAVQGQYVTVSTGEEFKKLIGNFAEPPIFDEDSVSINKLRVGLCKKENLQGERLCMCHFQKCRTYYTCNICEATICRSPPLQCPLCQAIIILPTDLYNHVIIS